MESPGESQPQNPLQCWHTGSAWPWMAVLRPGDKENMVLRSLQHMAAEWT